MLLYLLNVHLLLYLAAGALFGIVASLSARRGGRFLVAITTIAGISALIIADLLVTRALPPNNSELGALIPFDVVPPILAALLVLWQNRSPLLEHLLWGIVAWLVAMIPAGFLALTFGGGDL